MNTFYDYHYFVQLLIIVFSLCFRWRRYSHAKRSRYGRKVEPTGNRPRNEKPKRKERLSQTCQLDPVYLDDKQTTERIPTAVRRA